MRQGLEAKIAEVEALAERGRAIGTGAGVAKPPKFDGTTTWTVFQRQFETVAEHNFPMHLEKFTYLITALHGRPTDVLHGFPKGATHEEALEGRST
jgi:hypothetical protein